MSAYINKTDRRPFEERRLSARAVHRDGPDLHKLCEVLIRLTLRETGATRAAQLAAQAPETYRDPTPTAPAKLSA